MPIFLRESRKIFSDGVWLLLFYVERSGRKNYKNLNDFDIFVLENQGCFFYNKNVFYRNTIGQHAAISYLAKQPKGCDAKL